MSQPVIAHFPTAISALLRPFHIPRSLQLAPIAIPFRCAFFLLGSKITTSVSQLMTYGYEQIFSTYFTHSRSLTTAALSSSPPPLQAQAEPASESQAGELPLPTPLVAKYLFVVAGMVFAIIIVGGLTRLTESGLSITEWNVVSGILPPLSEADWVAEFEKYKATPEWRLFVLLTLTLRLSTEAR